MTFNLFYDIGFDCEQVYDYDLWAPYSMVVSELTLTENTWDSLDKGMDVETHKQIWGSTARPLCFKKKQSFANSVPAVLDLC